MSDENLNLPVKDIPEFTYPTLLAKDRSLRLFELLRSTAEPWLLHSRLVSHDLDAQPDFQALSYTWGNPFPGPMKWGDGKTVDWDSPTYKIMCNGALMYVPRNLYEALWQLHDFRFSGLLWCDQLCIDQHDSTERSAQVALMGDIYGSATQVICWLGRADKHTARVIELHEILAPALSAHLDDDTIDDAAKYDISDPGLLQTLKSSWNKPYEMTEPPPSLEHWRSYCCAFSERRWFKRLWILQELALARKVWILCGDKELQWDDMVLLARYMRLGRLHNDFCPANGLMVNGRFPVGEVLELANARDERLFDPPPLRPSTADFFARRYGAMKENELQCAFLLDKWRRTFDRHATDPRDKIYGLLGLLTRCFPDPESCLFKIDYKLTAVDVLIQSMASLVHNVPILSMFSLIADKSKRRMHGLPSWVPDPTAPSPLSTVSTLYAAGVRPSDMNPSEHRIYLPKFHKRIINGRLLTLSGLPVGCIMARSLAEGLDDSNDYEEVHSMSQVALSLPERYPLTDQGRVEVLWRTLIGDIASDDTRAEGSEGSLFHAWIVVWFMEFVRTARRRRYSSDHLEDGLVFISQLTANVPSKTEIEEYLEIRDYSAPRHNRWRDIIDASKSFVPIMDTVERCLCRTDSNLLSKCPQSTEDGDEIWIIEDARLPFVLRPIPGSDRYEFIGEAYVHGVQFGEAMKNRPAVRPVTLE